MNFTLERAHTKTRVSILTVLGILLLPVVIGAVLVAALYNPTERLDAINAAIVNDDSPVTIDGQMVPLGRQLSAGLVAGSDGLESNLSWTISNDEDARDGLADGSYQAVITIPKNFSAAATSTIGDEPEQATIAVQTSPDALIVDDAITAQITQTAAAVMGDQLSTNYLQNVFLGFSTLGDQLGKAADGADDLANGAAKAADGAAKLPGGAASLGDGASSLASGATDLASGLDSVSSGTADAADGAHSLAGGLRSAASKVHNDALLAAAQSAASSAKDAAGQSAGVAENLGQLAQSLGGAAAACADSGASAQFCSSITAAAGQAKATAQDAVTAATSAGTASGYADPTSSGLSTLITETSSGLKQAASQTDSLAAGLDKLASGGADAAGGARKLASGGTSLANGAGELSTGAQTLSEGVHKLADGADSLASGLHTAADSVPRYTESEAQNLATVVADPVAADGVSTELFGASAIPLLATVALWFGALASFFVLRATTRRALTSRAPSALLALRSFAPGAVIGAAQGLLVAIVLQIAVGYDAQTWWSLAGLSVTAGIAFAAVNQALVATLGGVGRWISVVIGALAMATGVVSTVPGALSSLAQIMPSYPAYASMVAVLTGTSGTGPAVAGLLAWAALSLVVSVLAVALRRTISARALQTRSLAPA